MASYQVQHKQAQWLMQGNNATILTTVAVAWQQ